MCDKNYANVTMAEEAVLRSAGIHFVPCPGPECGIVRLGNAQHGAGPEHTATAMHSAMRDVTNRRGK